jgi:hypothetical protein
MILPYFHFCSFRRQEETRRSLFVRVMSALPPKAGRRLPLFWGRLLCTVTSYTNHLASTVRRNNLEIQSGALDLMRKHLETEQLDPSTSTSTNEVVRPA